MPAPKRVFGRPHKPAPPGPGANLRAARIAAGLTLDTLARKLGTTETALSKVELGKQPTTLEWMYRAATALQCRPSDLDPRLTRTIPPAPPIDTTL